MSTLVKHSLSTAAQQNETHTSLSNEKETNSIPTSRSSSDRARLRRLAERRLEARTTPIPQNLEPCKNKGETDDQRHKKQWNGQHIKDFYCTASVMFYF